MADHLCDAIMRNGNTCGKHAAWKCYGQWYCGRHKKTDNILCTYTPNYSLANLELELLNNDPIGEENIQKLNGYINIKVGAPVFKNGETCSLVLISQISHNTQHFTRHSIAEELAKNIKFFLTKPTEYNLSSYSIDQMLLRQIKYDNEYGIFVADIVLIN